MVDYNILLIGDCGGSAEGLFLLNENSLITIYLCGGVCPHRMLFDVRVGKIGITTLTFLKNHNLPLCHTRSVKVERCERRGLSQSHNF